MKTVADCTFQRLTQQYLSHALQPCELACLHQEVESNSSPLQSGHLLGICLPAEYKRSDTEAEAEVSRTLCFPDAPTWGSVLQNWSCHAGTSPCHKESLPCRCSSWSQPLNHSGPSARHRSEDSSRCLQSLDNAVIS